MNHQEYRALRKGSSAAILMIHGIIGTPDHFDRFLPDIPSDFSVINLLLDGHGKGVRDFSKTSMKKWEAQVRDAVEELSAYGEKIYIVAHSMGTLLAIDEALKDPRIKGLFLLAVPLYPRPTRLMLRNAMKVHSGKIDPKDTLLAETVRSCSITHERNLFWYLGWIPRYLELFAKARHVRKGLSMLITPTVAIQSKGDEMVSERAVEELKKRSLAKVQVLEQSHHFYYPPEDLALLKESFKKFIKEIEG